MPECSVSESSPQLAQLLLPPGSGPGGRGAVSAGGRPDGAAAATDPAAGRGNAAFQQRLQALLAADATRAAGSGGAAGSSAAALTGLGEAVGNAGEGVVEAGAEGTASHPTLLAAGGNRLPESGNILPLSVAQLSQSSTQSSSQPSSEASQFASATDANRSLAELGGAPLSAGREALASQLRSAMTATGGSASGIAQGDVQSAAQTPGGQAIAAGEMPVDPMTEDPAALLRSATRANAAAVTAPGAESRAESGLTQAGATPVTDMLRQFQSQSQGSGGARERVAGAIDTGIPDSADFFTRRLAADRVAASAESSAAQFNLHARADSLLTPATSLSPEAALRDLAAMTPLRPQTGDASGSWASGLGQRLLMMAENGVEVARLRLNPASLGPLDIQVNIEDDRAQVWFGAQNSATRDALEAALPRLRDMFADQGLQLTRADVGERDGHSGGRESAAGHVAASSADGAASAVAEAGAGVAAAQAWGSPGGATLDIYV